MWRCRGCTEAQNMVFFVFVRFTVQLWKVWNEYTGTMDFRFQFLQFSPSKMCGLQCISSILCGLFYFFIIFIFVFSPLHIKCHCCTSEVKRNLCQSILCFHQHENHSFSCIILLFKVLEWNLCAKCGYTPVCKGSMLFMCKNNWITGLGTKRTKVTCTYSIMGKVCWIML